MEQVQLTMCRPLAYLLCVCLFIYFYFLYSMLCLYMIMLTIVVLFCHWKIWLICLLTDTTSSWTMLFLQRTNICPCKFFLILFLSLCLSLMYLSCSHFRICAALFCPLYLNTITHKILVYLFVFQKECYFM